MAAGRTRIRIDVAYDGTEFTGWAKQPGLRTCQGLLENALETVVRQPVPVTVAGRTDAGVHALGQVAHFDAPDGIADIDRLPRRLNSLMRASDIAVLRASAAPAGFDARFSATYRRYRYRLQLDTRNPLTKDAAHWRRELAPHAMQETAELLTGLHDFAAFCKAREGATTIRELREFSWRFVETDGPGRLFEAHVLADAFCHSMVRSLVGACVAVGEGRLGLAAAESLLQERKRSSAIPLMPANGLTLMEVGYPADADLAEQAERTKARRTPDDVEPRSRYHAEQPSQSTGDQQ